MAQNNDSKQWKSCFRNDLFEHKVALVTGGGTGIGRAIAKELAILGALVVISSRDEAKCKRAADEINKEVVAYGNGTKGQVVSGPSCSIKVEEDVKNLISHIIEKYGGINMLVNNAGGQFTCSAEDMSSNGFASVVDTNLKGTFLCCREAYTQYMRDHGGSIVNITLGNRNGMPMMVHSGAARAGIENMTATLCSEWVESDVRINCVRPGIIWTESGFVNYGDMGEIFLNKILNGLPAKRLGSAEEISSAVIWLLSEGASYVTGATICVDGGGSYHFLPIIDLDSNTPSLPVYGTLPKRAML